jgi:membrane protease YdiL (CAAX protease family)
MTQSIDKTEVQKNSIEKPKKNKSRIFKEEFFDLFFMFFISYLIISLFDENLLSPEKLYSKANIIAFGINTVILIIILTTLSKNKIILKEESFWAFVLKRLINLYPTSLKIFSSSFILFYFLETNFSNIKDDPVELCIILIFGVVLFIISYIIAIKKESFFQ